MWGPSFVIDVPRTGSVVMAHFEIPKCVMPAEAGIQRS